LPIVVEDLLVRDKSFNLQTLQSNEEPMGSTTFGNANPATSIGLAMPQSIRINRAGGGRVRVGGRS
jgi:hypothetical protein